MKTIKNPFLVLLLVAILAIPSGCNDREQLFGDSITTEPTSDNYEIDFTEPHMDVINDSQPESTDVSLDSVEEVLLPPFEETPACGNRVLDEGEECDDGNRLNGDGCDWSCHIGDGEPQPDPDPTVADYLPAGDPVAIPGAIADMYQYENIALVWTGTEYAAAWINMPDDTSSPKIEFRRFTSSGATIDTPWSYSAPTHHAGLELVWNGNGFGLFYVSTESGLYYLRLNSDGKPLSYPLLIEGDPWARAPAADVTEDGYILSWNHELGAEGSVSWCSSSAEDQDYIKAVIIDIYGFSISSVTTIVADAQGPPRIATGVTGLGILYPVLGCAPRFILVSDELSSGVSTGILGYNKLGDISWTGHQWAVAWPITTIYSSVDYEYQSYIGVALFSSDGILQGPPIMNSPSNHNNRESARIAAGDGGYVVVWSTTSGGNIRYIRTDSRGIAVGPVHDIVPEDTGATRYGPYTVVWSSESFGILYQQNEPTPEGLYLRHYIAEG